MPEVPIKSPITFPNPEVIVSYGLRGMLPPLRELKLASALLLGRRDFDACAVWEF